jgi:hypothetical protein
MLSVSWMKTYVGAELIALVIWVNILVLCVVFGYCDEKELREG